LAPKNKSIVAAIVTLAKSLGLQVVVEGVETETQRGFVLRTGADLMQGYLFAAPLTVEEIEALFKNGALLGEDQAGSLQLKPGSGPLAKSA